jgi:hypothetical protein
MNDEGLADVEAADPFRLPRLHPGIGSTAMETQDVAGHRLRERIIPEYSMRRRVYHRRGRVSVEHDVPIPHMERTRDQWVGPRSVSVGALRRCRSDARGVKAP